MGVNRNPFVTEEELLVDTIVPLPPARLLHPLSPPLNPNDPFATPPQTPDSLRPLPSARRSADSAHGRRAYSKAGIYGPSPLPSPTGSVLSLGGGSSVGGDNDQCLTGAPGKKSDRCKRSSWSRFWESVNSRFSPKEIWDLINPVEYLWPITLKKYVVLLLVASIVTGIVMSNAYTGWIGKSMAITRSYMLPVLIIVIGLEPLMFLIILVAARMPGSNENGEETARIGASDEKQVDVEAQPVSSPADAYETAFVIPCHNSDREALRKVFDSAAPYFRPRDIFVVDNGRSRHPADLSFRDWVKAQHPDINYIWSPIGSKNAAQMVGAMAARHYRYILTADDDVSLPSNYRHPVHMINDEVKAVAFPLKGIDANGDCPLFLVAWQDAEYRMAGLTKLAESSLCGVCFPHGAGWFVERDSLVELLSRYHPIDFIAEDVNSGFSLMRMKKRIAFDARVILATEVPTTLLGTGLNWFKQRMKSWEMGRHGLLFKFIRRFFALNGQRTLIGVLSQKFIMLYSVASIIVDWVRVPILVTMGTNAEFWRNAVLLSLASTVPLLLYNYIKCRRRPDMRVRFLAALTFPVYKQLYAFVSIVGGIRCALFYVGGHVKAKPIYKMVEDGDEACFWLDPRFDENPGWLADEKEEMVREGVEIPQKAHSTSSIREILNRGTSN